MRTLQVLSLFLSTLLFSGCTTYYVVKDNASGKSYFTTDIEQLSGGGVKFRDEQSSAVVIIQSFDITRVESEEYRGAMNNAGSNRVRSLSPRSRDEN